MTEQGKGVVVDGLLEGMSLQGARIYTEQRSISLEEP